MEKQLHPRNVRSYKVKDKPYFKAQKAAAKQKTDLSKVIERVVNLFGEGYHIIAQKENDGAVHTEIITLKN